MKTPYWLRLSIAGDAMIQITWRYGTPGVTMSSRMGTAAAHGHLWGLTAWWLLDRCWPFGRDKVTGESHCKGAIENDKIRAQQAIDELNDPVVLAYLALPTCGEIDLAALWKAKFQTMRSKIWDSIAASTSGNLSLARQRAGTNMSKTASFLTSTAKRLRKTVGL